MNPPNFPPSLTAILLWVIASAQSALAAGFQTQLADEEILALAEQPNGAVLVGGNFTQFAGTSRLHLARVFSDGNLDPAFNPAANNDVNCFAVQDDGKIVVGGRFTAIAGQSRIAIARLNPDGTLDPTLSANANQRVSAIAIQPDGKIIIAGWFTQVAGVTHEKIARLLPGGGIDPSFNPIVDGNIQTMNLDAEGRILIGGDFSSVGITQRRGMARLLANGALDTTFVPAFNGSLAGILALSDGRILGATSAETISLRRWNSDGSVDATFLQPSNFQSYTMCVQTDGRIVIGGNVYTSSTNFTAKPSGLLRLQPTGALDTAFTGPNSALVWSTVIRSDGSVLVGDDVVRNQFTFRLSQVVNSATQQSLEFTAGSVSWLRSGSLPELESVAFQTSPDGSTWTHLGFGTRVTGGWQVAGITPPTTGHLRARGRTRGGEGNGSSGLIEFVTVLGGGGSTQSYAAWAAATLPAGTRLPGDSNGPLALQNLVAYSLGINPAVAQPQDLPSLVPDSATPGQLKFTYTRSKTAEGVGWQIQSAPTLGEWGAATLISHLKVSEVAARETWQATIATAGSGKAFFRLQVTLAD